MKAWSLIVAFAAGITGVVAAAAPRAADSVVLNNNKPSFTFDYTVATVDSTNWVALYTGGNNPSDGSKRSYTTWAYAPDASGSVFIDSASVAEGDYDVYLLAKNGYDILAGPIKAKQNNASSFAYRPKDKPMTFEYKTNAPDKKNWIAVYPANSTKPVKSGYLAWNYATESSGTVVVSATNITPGPYDAYFLAKDGYTQLADKISFVYQGDTGPVSFITPHFTTQNARQGDPFRANIAGLINPRAEKPSFKIVSQTKARWAKIDADGTITGTPSCATGNATVVVEATIADGTTDRLTVTIPCVAKGQPLVTNFRFLTMNLWIGGAYVSDSYRKQIRFFADLNPDVIVFQETVQTAGQRLAKALGWYVAYSGDTAIISRYPVTQLAGTDASTQASVAFDGEDSKVIVYSGHLGYDPYGPYDFCKYNMTMEQVMKREAESGRTPQITEITNDIKKLMPNASRVPILLAGDFNAPSHLDWTEASKADHCGIGYVAWPTSKIPVDAGMIDSFRELYPDPVRDPAFTWSPIHPAPEEPQDRIDFIYYAGGAKVTESKPIVVGVPKPSPNEGNNEWTTDHAAFYSDFKLLPSAMKARN